ncbi:hypothetical protein OIU34_21870 [Pararhizobium sp. BT-229]|uniref:hypothetical protein n=1 Tax=Pararhizobium sp. BT-229 TaxID=2986923 RepID=UPI0021F7A716|nr:hypothetical protein [Pararhizobium sp. BT-229]MCV9964542.1 hypothetical protein [Pararhizobium sp. BT-229]
MDIAVIRYAILAATATFAADAVAADWRTGQSNVEWRQGTACGEGATCFEIHQIGAGQIGHWGTRDCWRPQVWTTTIRNAPPSIDRHDVVQASGYWNFGVRSVEFKDGTINIQTFVIQDHGGPGNPCLKPGRGDFTLRFGTTKE